LLWETARVKPPGRREAIPGSLRGWPDGPLDVDLVLLLSVATRYRVAIGQTPSTAGNHCRHLSGRSSRNRTVGQPAVIVPPRGGATGDAADVVPVTVPRFRGVLRDQKPLISLFLPYPYGALGQRLDSFYLMSTRPARHPVAAWASFGSDEKHEAPTRHRCLTNVNVDRHLYRRSGP